MREIRPSGSEGGARSIPCSYPYPILHSIVPANEQRENVCLTGRSATSSTTI